MVESSRRVVLLARAGVACDRLRSALADAGAQLVLEGDPTVLDPAALDAADPEVVVVVLDPASEDALDRFENLLVDPSIEVIFEEAELAAAREGWDAARWSRHLSAKLHRHDDVLPPGREPEGAPEALPGAALAAPADAAWPPAAQAGAAQVEAIEQGEATEAAGFAPEPMQIEAIEIEAVAPASAPTRADEAEAIELEALALDPASLDGIEFESIQAEAVAPEAEEAAPLEAVSFDEISYDRAPAHAGSAEDAPAGATADAAAAAAAPGQDERLAAVVPESLSLVDLPDPPQGRAEPPPLPAAAGLGRPEGEESAIEALAVEGQALEEPPLEGAALEGHALDGQRLEQHSLDEPLIEWTADEPAPAAPQAVALDAAAFDPGRVDPVADPLSFAGLEGLSEYDRIAPTPSAGDRILTQPPPLPEEAREFFARQAVGDGFGEPHAADASYQIDELSLAEDTGLDGFDAGRTQPEGIEFELADASGDALQMQDWDAAGQDEAWRAPAPAVDAELIDFDAAFADRRDSEDRISENRAPESNAPQSRTPAASGLSLAEGGELAPAPAAAPYHSDFDPGFASADAPLVERVPAPQAPAAPDWSFSDEAGLVGAASGQAPLHAAAEPRHDLAEIERRISALELVDDSQAPVDDGTGAVLVLAGIGGPDAVRQLLGALPENFGRPVLVQQRLDGGRYDRLVAQMQRATPVLVKLAEAGSRTIDGVIYILPAELGIEVGESGIQFVEGADVLSALPAAGSAVLLFSGADPAQVETAMQLAQAGALVAGQAPDGCYDAVAATAAIERGASAGQPAELAQKLAARWAKAN